MYVEKKKNKKNGRMDMEYVCKWSFTRIWRYFSSQDYTVFELQTTI